MLTNSVKSACSLSVSLGLNGSFQDRILGYDWIRRIIRQHALGKVDNCQVGVCLADSNATEATLIHRQLYLPEEWFLDPKRLQEAGVPKDRQLKTKGELPPLR